MNCHIASIILYCDLQMLIGNTFFIAVSARKMAFLKKKKKNTQQFVCLFVQAGVYLSFCFVCFTMI